MATPNNVIELSDSDSDSGDFTSGHSAPDRPRRTATINVDDDGDSADCVNEEDDLELLADGSEWLGRYQRRTAIQVLLGLSQQHKHLQSYSTLGQILDVGTNVPLIDGSFLRIKHITQHKCTGEVSVHGLLLKRPSEIDRQVKRSTGDLVWQIFTNETDNREDSQRGIETVPFARIDFGAEKFHRTVIFTNSSSESVRDPRSGLKKFQNDVWANGTLVCRVKNIQYYTIKGGRAKKPNKEAWVWLREHETDEGHAVPDICKTENWLKDRRDAAFADAYAGDPSRSASTTSTVRDEQRTQRSTIFNREDIVEIEESAYRKITIEHTIPRVKGSSTKDRPVLIKMADICCGLGCVSRGAEKAGIKPTVAVDRWHVATDTCRKNFPTVTIYTEDVADFISSGRAKTAPYCHVVHISFPCPYFSPNHTRSNNPERDRENSDIVFALEELLKSLRPMYVTFENTSGLKHDQHREYFSAMIRGFTDLGWSVVHKVCKLSDYGTSQQRKRLIMIAACPGRRLIEFPLPTHGTEPGLKPLTTVGDCIRPRIRPDALHDLEDLRRRHAQQPRALFPAKSNEPLQQLIDTSGPHALAPAGDREFSFREGMRLMGLPDNHTIAESARTKKDKWTLIGNGYPPQLPTIIFKEISAVLQDFFKRSAEPVSIDADSDQEVRKPVLPGRKRTRNVSVMQPSDGGDVDASQKRRKIASNMQLGEHGSDAGVIASSVRSFSVPVRSRQTPQPSVTDAFRVQKKTKVQASTTTLPRNPMGSGKSVVDLTED